MPRENAADTVNKFLVPHSGVLSQNSSLNRQTHSTLRPSYQVPPLERGDFKAFSTTSRGAANIIAPCPVKGAPQDAVSAASATNSTGPLKSLDDVWRTSLFGRASQVASFPPEKFMSQGEDGNVCIVRFLPERFERCRVQRPELVEEHVAPSTLHDDGARLMHPQVRRQIHEQEVNGKQGEAHLRESLRERSKIFRACLHKFPHGALGLADSPYTEQPSPAYTNASALSQEHRLAMRRSRGGQVPPTTIGEVLHPDTHRT